MDLLYNETLNSNLTNLTDALTTTMVDVSISSRLLDPLKRQYEDHFLLTLNFFALILFFVDKLRAQEGGWRVREVFLYICCLDAPIASISGMLIACHKLRKISFYVAVFVGLFLMYLRFGFIADNALTWWKILGFINIGVTFLTLAFEC